MNKSQILDNIFKAYDVRGKVGSELKPEIIEEIGSAVAVFLPTTGPVAVGRDMRPDSEQLANAIISGLTKQGREVWDIGQVTSDMVYFATGHHDLAGGVMVTASHNPGEYNGIKFCGQQASPIGIESGLLEIKKLVEKGDFPETQNHGTVQQKDVMEDWLSHALSFIDVDKLKSLNAVIDAGNGMAGKVIPELEPYVPLNIEEMYFELDGSFPNHIANPIEPENIKDLIAKVQKSKADVGIAFDGDGDRAVLIDETGKAVSGTVMTALLAEHFLKKNPGSTILYNATCGWIVPETIEKHKGKAVRTKVGHSFIKAEMKKHSALFAGESSGHYYFEDNYNADSGLIAALVAIHVLSASKKKLSELVAKYDVYHHIPETNFTVEDKEEIINKVASHFSDEKQDRLDGLTVWQETSWLNIRPSNTEPILRLNAEARSKPELEKLVDKVTSIVNS
jgi:phosphomannomutase